VDEDVQAAKRRMRAALRHELRAVSPEQMIAAGEALASHMLGALPIRGRIGLFASLPDEIPMRPLFEALRAAGREVMLPRVVERRLAFAFVDGWRELVPGDHGLLEPRAALPSVEPAAEDWFVVPGLAFDPLGRRLGRGGGFYDRVFEHCAPRAPTRVGAAFSLQVVESVPHDSRDRPVDAIVTEDGFRWARERR
jgi:5-formyltetrahydrofolate cyclo-ligase